MIMALITAGETEEARSLCDDLLAHAETADDPGARCFALLAYGYALRDSRPMLPTKHFAEASKSLRTVATK